MGTAEHLRTELIDALTASGALQPDWAPSFHAAARHQFVPDTIWHPDPAGRLRPLNRHDDPALWLNYAYADAPIDTQVDDGHPAPDGTGHEVTSSASMPTVVAQMLTALDLRPGMRVLEIGTGTGWNAALLAHRVGAAHVVSVEIDPDVADRARAALNRTGFGAVTVITGDGEHGAADPGATDPGSFDRVIATVAARTIPYPWVSQTRPGGRIVVPLTNSFQPPGIATLDVDATGTAHGRLGARAAFMHLRGQRIPRPHGMHFGNPAESVTTTEIHPWHWASDRDAATAVGQCLGDGVHTVFQPPDVPDGTGVQWISDPASRSWAAVDIDGGTGPYAVEQAGPRRLHDEVAIAYRWWVAIGSPPATAWTVTVGPPGQLITVDSLRSITPVTPLRTYV